MQRFRAALLALGLVTLLTGLGSGVLAAKAAEEHDHDLRLEGASSVTALDDYAERARAVALLASHSAAFAELLPGPGRPRGSDHRRVRRRRPDAAGRSSP